MNFEEILKNIISVDELLDFAKVEEKLKSISEGYIFQNNKPTHVIMTLENFESLKNDSLDTKKETNTTSDGLDVLLNKIGKKIFIEYYYTFKFDDNPEEKLKPEGFTLASRRSRSSSARTIFKNNQQLEALKIIIDSDRIDLETVEQAKELLKMESENSNSFAEDEIENYDVKIGKMMKGILTKLIKNNIFDKDMLLQLQTPEYSKATFNMNFPVIKVLKEDENPDLAKRDAKGYNRYYDRVIQSQSNKYLICSQWIKNLHQARANQWTLDRMIEILDTEIAHLDINREFVVRELLIEYWPYIGCNLRRTIGKVAFTRIFKDNPNIEVLGKTQHGYSYKKIAE